MFYRCAALLSVPYIERDVKGHQRIPLFASFVLLDDMASAFGVLPFVPVGRKWISRRTRDCATPELPTASSPQHCRKHAINGKDCRCKIGLSDQRCRFPLAWTKRTQNERASTSHCGTEPPRETPGDEKSERNACGDAAHTPILLLQSCQRRQLKILFEVSTDKVVHFFGFRFSGFSVFDSCLQDLEFAVCVSKFRFSATYQAGLTGAESSMAVRPLKNRIAKKNQWRRSASLVRGKRK